MCLCVNFTCSYFFELLTIVLPPLGFFFSYRDVSVNRLFTLSSPFCLGCLLSHLNDTSLHCPMLLSLEGEISVSQCWEQSLLWLHMCSLLWRGRFSLHQFVQCIGTGWCCNLPNTFLYWLKRLYLLFSSCSVFWNEIHTQMEIYQRNVSFLFFKSFLNYKGKS